ncbi:MAG: response regulator transcription factor [Endomicrobiaceae bacterium]|nr:response regulator transcription factor [Endomicrobiaceae bacterium]MDD5102273.1 response regulator transcription factor [Endomicrobiaceae bacterium]
MYNKQKKYKILIIDDDKVFLETMCTILKMEGFDVHDAETAESGYEAMVNIRPSLVMLDINLPDKNGFDVLISIKNSKNFSEIPVVLITADTAVLVDEAFEKGADDCFFKPINPKEIISRINRILDEYEN